jgi:hypothetical protein
MRICADYPPASDQDILQLVVGSTRLRRFWQYPRLFSGNSPLIIPAISDPATYRLQLGGDNFFHPPALRCDPAYCFRVPVRRRV